MAPNASAPKGGSIDDILRALKPKGVEIPEARPPIVDPLPGEFPLLVNRHSVSNTDRVPDHKPGGIDAVLAKLKPMPPKPASPTAGPNEHIAATEPSARAGEPTITPGLVVPVFPTGERDIKNTVSQPVFSTAEPKLTMSQVQHDDENTVVLGRTGSTTAATRRHMAQLDITAARQHILQTQSVSP